jgi:hypothetical protein
MKLGHGRAAKSLMHTGRLRWRFLVLLVLLGAVGVPLKKAFVQVSREAVARGVVQQAIRQLLPAGALVSQQVDVEPSSISVRLFSTTQVPEAKRAAAERRIQERSGRSATLTVASVASQSELAEMMERLNAVPVATAPPPVAPVETIDAMRAKLLERIAPAVTAVWPAEAPLAGFDIWLSDQGVTLDAEYKSDRDLSAIALGMITRQLREKLNLPTLVVAAHRARASGSTGRERKPIAR